MPDDLAPRDYYDGLTARSLMAGWARREQPTGSKSEMHVHVWRADEARAAPQEASLFVGTDVAERRNLIMVNPAPGNTYATTRNIVAAYQMIQSGETARSHRHTPAALRLVLDVGDDVYTVVDGKRVDMTPGDVVLTPSWCWHGHARHMRRDICRQISQLGDPRSHRPIVGDQLLAGPTGEHRIADSG
jgi:gentisate 1,2-dioxygenase